MRIEGTDNKDNIYGTGADDVIDAGLGKDVINGSYGSDLIDGGDSGDNQVDYAGAPEDYSFSRNSDGTIRVVKPGGGVDTLTNINSFWFTGARVWKPLDEVLVETPATDPEQPAEPSEPATGGSAETTGENTITGTNGNDDLRGTNGNDTIDGGKGVDVITGSGGNDFINGGDNGYNQIDYAGKLTDYSFTRQDNGTIRVEKPGGGVDIVKDIGGFWFTQDKWYTLEEVLEQSGTSSDKQPAMQKSSQPEACSSIGDYVWLDTDGNGRQDGNEQAVSGVTVNLLDANGNIVATQQTDATGKYLFSDLNAGSYQVEFVTPDGYTFTSSNAARDDLDSDANPGTGRSDVINLGDNEHIRTVDAGLCPPAQPGPGPDPEPEPGSPPVAIDDNCRVPCDSKDGVTIDVLANDSDADGDMLTAALKTQPTNGTITQNQDGTFSYVPKDGFYGHDEFTYTVSDGNGGTAEATVTIDVERPTVTSFSSNDFRMTEGETKELAVGLDKVVTEDTTITVKLHQDTAKLADENVKLYTGHSWNGREGTFYFGNQTEKDETLAWTANNRQMMWDRYRLTEADVRNIPVGDENAVQDFQLLDSRGNVIDVAADGTFEVEVKAGQSASESFKVKALYDMHMPFRHDTRDYQEGAEKFSLEVIGVEGAECLEKDEITGTIDNEYIRHTPVAIDLNRDGEIGVTGETSSHDKAGVETVGRTVEFDIDGDGDLDQIEWFDGSGDGILVDNRDGNAANDMDGMRLFGGEGGQYANGYDKLATFDENGDGKLSGDELEGLEFWVDDGDAVVEDGEMQSLAKHDIAEISTRMDLVTGEDGRELMRSSAMTGEGEEIMSEDVWFLEYAEPVLDDEADYSQTHCDTLQTSEAA